MGAEVVLVVRYGSETATVSINGSMIAATGEGLAGEFDDLLGRLNGTLVVDLSGVDECDPSGVARLADLRVSADAVGVELVVTGLDEDLHDCLALAGLEPLVPVA
jgi:anti-anti-sigma factor